MSKSRFEDEKSRKMSPKRKITRDATRVAGEIVERGFWRRYEMLTDTAAAEIARTATLWYADLEALEELLGRKLTKNDHRLWEIALRVELERVAPVAIQ